MDFHYDFKVKIPCNRNGKQKRFNSNQRSISVTTSIANFSTDIHTSLSTIAEPQQDGMPHVSILMCSYNGERFISEQLGSIERQTHANWSLIVSDDGSEDATLQILEQFGKRWNTRRLKIVSGPGRGFAANFLSLTSRTDIKSGLHAWSDQDDIWHADKLARAVTWLKTIPEYIPALYCARSELVGETGSTIGYSPLFRRPPQFTNALVQSISGGNTMVFNEAARALLQEAGAMVNVPSHDWWAYQLISGAGGEIYYDPEPRVQYRQHDGNVVGGNIDWSTRLKRARMVFQGRFITWNSQNIQALETMIHRLKPENKTTLLEFRSARNQRLINRILGVWRTRVHRQTLFQNLALFLATLFKKI